MRLSNSDVELFYKLQWGLMFFVNQRYQIIKRLENPDFRGQKLEDVAKIHERIYSNTGIVDEFVKTNPFGFSKEELDIVKSWKNFVKNNFFIIIENNRKHTIFLSAGKDPKAYGVMSLYDDLADEIPHTPFALSTTLLPFKGKITYSGIFGIINMTFGSGIRKGFQTDYQKAKSRFGIITSLDEPIHERNESEEEMLRFYASNETRRLEYCDEIENILKKNPSLINAYQQELSKFYARKIKKRLVQLNARGWFAVLEDTIIASGKNKNEVLQRAKEIISPKELGSIHMVNSEEEV